MAYFCQKFGKNLVEMGSTFFGGINQNLGGLNQNLGGLNQEFSPLAAAKRIMEKYKL